MEEKKLVLLVTSSSGFGELIQEALEGTGCYKVLQVDSTLEAYTCAQHIPFSLGILDSDLQENDLPYLISSLAQVANRFPLLAIITEDEAHQQLRSRLSVDAFINKPFYLPSFLEAVEAIFEQPKEPYVLAEQEPILTKEALAFPARKSCSTWEQDATRAAQLLTRLTLEPGVLAALITCQAKLWAYAGQLEQPHVQDLLDSALHWMDQTPSAVYDEQPALAGVVRIIHLDALSRDLFIYKASLGMDAELILVCDLQTPISTLRTKANDLAQDLFRSTKPQLSMSRRSTLPRNASPRSTWSNVSKPRSSVDPPRRAGEDAMGGEPLSLSSSILPEDIPPAFPYQPYQEEDAAWESNLLSSPRSPESFPDPLLPEGQEQALRAISPALHSIYCICVLIPRLPERYLVGVLSMATRQVISQLCLAYGWRLESIVIRPQYAQWIVNLSPQIPPSYVIKTIRQRSSRRLFDTDPALEDENPSGDFWAPGFLIISGSQPPSPQVIQDYIQHTRQYQGVPPLNPMKV